MGSIVVYRAIGIERRVESQSCAYACAFHLSIGGDVSVDVMPSQQRLSDVWLRFEPSLVDGMSQTVCIDGGAGCHKPLRRPQPGKSHEYRW